MTPICLADLVRAFAALSPSPSDCTAIARLLGLKGTIIWNPTPVAEAEAQSRPSVTPEPRSNTAAEAKDYDPGVANVRNRIRPAGWQYEPWVEPPGSELVGHPIKLTELRGPPVGDMPSYIADEAELDFSSAARLLPTPTPLIPRGLRRSLAADLVMSKVPGDFDIPRIVEAIARGQLPTVLPRRQRRGIARRVHVLLDTAGAMHLFRTDGEELIESLHDVAGPALQSEEVTHGPPSLTPWPNSARGDILVIISHLGLGSPHLAGYFERAAWCSFLARQRRRGLCLVALVPFHYQRWPSTLKRQVRLVHWHSPGEVAVPIELAQLRHLARALSLASVIDPALLRAARTRLFPAADAGAEADLANGPWVAVSNPRIISFATHWLVELRGELARDPAFLEAARYLLETQRPRTGDWARVLFGEEIIYLSLQARPDDLEQIKRGLARIIRSLLGRLRQPASARWALCFLEELPEAVRQTDVAQLLKAVASIILNTSFSEVGEIVAAQNAKWVFGSTTQLGVLWTGDHIVLREPPQTGDMVLEVPRTSPRVVIVSDLNRPRRKVLRITPLRPPAWTRATFLPRLLKTPAGAEYRLDDARETWTTLLLAFESKQILRGLVMRPWSDDGQLRAGFLVDVGLDAFMSERQFILRGGNPDTVIGSKVDVLISHIDRKNRRISVEFVPSPSRVPSDVQTWQEVKRHFAENKRVAGVVAAFGLTGYAVDVLGYRGFLHLNEVQPDELQDPSDLIGRTLEFCITECDDAARGVVLSRRLDDWSRWMPLIRSMTENKLVAGTIQRVTKGGLLVDVGIEAFLPAQELDFSPTGYSEPTDYVGFQFAFRISQMTWWSREVVLALRGPSQEDDGSRRARLVAELRPGDIRTGVVKSISVANVFVDIGGLNAQLKLNDISWRRIRHPSEVLQAGQEIQVIVLAADPEKGVFIGLKQMTANPWDNIDVICPVGSRVNGKVVNLVPYGAFIEIEPGVEGLIHVTELSWKKRGVTPAEVLKIGQEVTAIVLGIQKQEQKVSLGLRQLQTNPWDTFSQKHPIGARVRARIRKILPYGAFVELEEGLDGLVHISDISWTRMLSHPSELLTTGDEVAAIVLMVDPTARRISLGIKQSTLDPWRTIDALFHIGDVLAGTITRVEPLYVVVTLKDDFDGILDCPSVDGSGPPPGTEALQAGQAVRVRIVKIDREERKLHLSLE